MKLAIQQMQKWTQRDWTKVAMAIGVVATAAILPEIAHAIAIPVAGVGGAPNPLGYEIYDVAVNKMLNGPVGFVAGVGIIGFGAMQIMKAWPLALLGVLGGSAMLKADDIVTTLGALI